MLQFGLPIFPHCALNSSNNPSAHDSNIVNICRHTTGGKKMNATGDGNYTVCVFGPCSGVGVGGCMRTHEAHVTG